MITRMIGCAFAGHRWVAISNLPLCGRIRARCERCGRVDLVTYR